MATNDMVCGVWPVIEALRAGKNVEKLLIRREAGGDGVKEIRQLALDRDIPWQPVPVEKLDRLTKTEHQGVIAFLSQVEEQDLNEVITMAYERGEVPFILALDSVTDVRNMGAIARSAECFGVHAMLVPKMGTARLGPDAVKSSAGALLRKPVCRVNRFTDALRAAREQGLRIVACTEKGTLTLDDADLNGPLVLVMGSEDEGISDAVIRMADDLVNIPMAGSIGSLNVSVATGIVLHAALRQRKVKV
ncbi:MAG: 23S rRNA (guanosine(2251)-2'-O)-methyltransferase RlmB [Flavobacteriales bacterium]|nr:23S rRNA (guanosine(2251)-2'-O)-methyltransferase RlmB [Flavobacteriales bacterium]MBP6643687.1 23S rRNA (guanosine(2251)-2'-O)-methyltransferase RlmB [Flavobacteriales bacterium]MBP7154905.1 23S rRNA (guanosine(2251)-2'-O)-methyltransferase RlmB [Flavobacteriales bacterium]HQV74709.1 23S rRNA (guanosine(2251)-2'-O)-methyltransferase RlmB [Flavobacteriales bacterium]HQW39975.1 23S rRNA (guanosine(2251)-2'-O)-methyltransferase RlmB [Flavobacteriales bacterium]